jgi:hypothetical protein
VAGECLLTSFVFFYGCRWLYLIRLVAAVENQVVWSLFLRGDPSGTVGSARAAIQDVAQITLCAPQQGESRVGERMFCLLRLLLQSLWASPADRRSVLGVVTFWFSILYLIPTGKPAGCTTVPALMYSICPPTCYDA